MNERLDPRTVHTKSGGAEPTRVDLERLVKAIEDRDNDMLAKLLEANTAAAEAKARLDELDQKMSRGAGSGSSPAEDDGNLGKALVNSEEFKTFVKNGARGQTRISVPKVKAVGTVTSGSTFGGPLIAPDYRPNLLMPLPQRRFTIRDLLAPGQTNGNAVLYPRQTARQNNAAPVAELAQKPQSDFSMEIASAPVRTIAHFMHASRQALDDAPALASLIDTELRYGLAFTEEIQFLLGDGTGENILGIMPQASAFSAAFMPQDPTPIDYLALAILQTELAYLPATGIVLHPTDWARIRLTKDAEGRYIVGNPQDMVEPRLWSLPVVVTPAVGLNRFLVGSFAYGAQVFDRMETEVLASSENANNFEINRITIRGEERVAMAVKRPTAFVTGNVTDGTP